MNRIALGTVQFGQEYGIANSNGMISKDEAFLILDFAKQNGVDTIDTAILYGESEKKLGELGVNDFNIISKLPPVPEMTNNLVAWVFNQLENSLYDLRVPSIEGLLIHHAKQLTEKNSSELFNALLKLKEIGLVNKIGVSVYDPLEIEFIINNFDIDIIQLPFNILDQRIIESNLLHKLEQKKIEVHVRSVFLQGLLLMEPEARPEKFCRWNETVWDQYDKWIKDNNVSRLQACLNYVLSFPAVSKIVVGVDSHTQLKEILKTATMNMNGETSQIRFNSNDMLLINPSRWKEL